MIVWRLCSKLCVRGRELNNYFVVGVMGLSGCVVYFFILNLAI